MVGAATVVAVVVVGVIEHSILPQGQGAFSTGLLDQPAFIIVHRPAVGVGAHGIPAALLLVPRVRFVNATYIPLSEEPGLVNRFVEDYLDYKRNVPRWIPRWTPGDGGARDAS